jgi:hypothetical protein
MTSHPESVEHIESACQEAQRITGITETFHNKPAIKSPVPNASSRRTKNEGRAE